MQLTVRRSSGSAATLSGGTDITPIKPSGWRFLQAGLVLTALLAGFLWQQPASELASAVQPPRPAEDFRFVPVRVHLLRAPEAPAIGTTLTKADVERIFRKANDIWHAAGIHLFTESVVEEAPSAIENPHLDALRTVDQLRPLRPAGTRPDRMFHLYYVGRMGVNGIFIARDAVFVQQAAALREVEGGIDEPLPRVSSHELGHGLGLEHRQARTNLMASGTTGTSLNDAEIATARGTCEKLSWVLPAKAFLEGADKLQKAGKRAEAEARYRAVASLPGDSTLKSRAVEALGKSK